MSREIKRKYSGMDKATIEDLAFLIRSSRASDIVRRRVGVRPYPGKAWIIKGRKITPHNGKA